MGNVDWCHFSYKDYEVAYRPTEKNNWFAPVLGSGLKACPTPSRKSCQVRGVYLLRKPMNKRAMPHFTIAALQAESAFDEADWT